MKEKKHIVLITDKQPSSNPRLVKEAISLKNEGYQVSVVYNFWSTWAENADANIFLENKDIAWIKVRGNPTDSPLVYALIRIRHIIFKKLAIVFPDSLYINTRAITLFYQELQKKASEIKADLYIAHNAGALAVASASAKKRNTKYAFDAEDFHREQDVENVKHNKVVSSIENLYFPGAAYITAASPLIAKAYKVEYPHLSFHVVNNVFSKHQQPEFKNINQENGLNIFWFSQTVGLKRGLQEVISAVNKVKDFAIQLTVLGDVAFVVKETLQQLLINPIHCIEFLPPTNETELIKLCSTFHIGLALEPGFSLNNDIALSNKLFTYILAGNAVILSDTSAQIKFYNQYPEIGWCYKRGDVTALVAVLEEAYNNKALLSSKRLYSWKLANEHLNWENEQQIFLKLVENTF